MASLDVIRKLTIRATTEGVDQAAASVEKLADSQGKLAAASVKTEKATLSVDQALQRTARRYDQEARAQQDLAQVQKTLNAARDQGLISQSRQNELMSLAIRAHNSAGAAAQQHSRALQELSTASQGLAGNLGSVGGILARMGPVGLAVAATIAVITLGFAAAASAALSFADEMGKLADTAETIGFTVEKLKALQVAAAEVGISGEQLNGMMEKFSVTLGKVREGDEGAIKSMNRLQAGLADAVRTAGSADEKFQLVIDALGKVDKATAAVSAREIFGRAGLAAIRLAGLSLDELVQNMNAIDKAAIASAKSFDAIGDSVKKNFAQAGTNIKSAFAGPVLQALEPISNIVLELSRTFVLLASGPIATLFEPLITGAKDVLIQLNTLNIEIANLGAGAAFQNLGQRLFGPQVTAAITLVVSALQALGEAIVAVISLFAALNRAAIAALSFNIVGNFQEQLNAAAAAVGQLQTAYSNVRDAAALAIPQITATGTAAQQSGQSLAGTTESWVRYASFQNDVVRSGERWLDQQTKLPPQLNASTSAVGKQTKALKENNDVLKELGQVAGQLGSSLVTAFLNGDSAAKALNSTLKSISASAASKAIDKLTNLDFAGAAVSGAISIGAAIGSFLFGDDEDEKKAAEAAKQRAEQVAQAAAAAAEQLRQAQAAFAGLTDEVAAFNREVAGLVEGDLTAAIRELLATSIKLQEAASAAGDVAGLEAIRVSGAAGILRLVIGFLEDFPDAIAEFGAGGPITDAKNNMKAVIDQFNNFNDSLMEVARLTGDIEGVQLRSAQLQQAAIKAALATFNVDKPLSAFVDRLTDIKARAEVLENALVELGVAAEDAAQIVNTRLTVALKSLNDEFFDPLIREVNRLAGGDWINQAQDLFNRVQELNADAAALGIKTTLILEFYVRSAQEIVDQNQLVGDSFLALQRMLGLAGTSLHEFNAAIEETAAVVVRSAQEIADAIQSNEDRLFLAIHRSDSLQDQLLRFDLAAQREREAEIKAGGQALASLERALAQERLNIIADFAAAQAEEAKRAAEEAERARQQQIEAAQRAAEEIARAFQEAVDFISAQVRRIQDFIADFLSSPESILKPSEQLAAAQQHFASELSAAASGNRDALSNITGNAQNVIDAVRRYYGSSAAGQGLIQQLLGQLQGLPSLLSPEEFIVKGVTEAVVDLGTTITDVTIDQTEILAALLENLRLALQTGDAQAFALALLPLFEQLDTTMDQALNIEELRAALGSDFDTGTLDRIFKELDGNGNGLLEKAELIKAATGGTEVAVGTSNSLLDAIKVQTAFLSFIANMLTSINLHVEFCDHLATIAAWVPGSSHAMGGWISGGIPGRDSVHARLMPGEFVVRSSIAQRNPWLEGFNATGIYPANDNGGGFVGAIHGLERSLLRGIAALIETQLQTAGVIAKPIEEANKLQRTRRGEKKKAA